ncbi:MAG: RDD family protein [Helicobacter sp.]|nr:RDD family protein [Helicobacter sp.]
MKETIEEILGREEIEIAPLSKRLVAFLIDDLLVSLVWIAIYWESIAEVADDSEAVLKILSASILVVYAIKILYQWLFVMYYGATIGKIVMRIRVIEVELLDNPNAMQSLVRSLFRALSEVLMYMPFFLVLENKIHQALHDRIAKTIVIDLK